MRANLGYIGLGAMGGQMADRLLSKGHTVTGYNRTRSKAEWLIHKGLKWADSPRAVCDAADVTFVIVTNSASLEAAADGPDGVLAGLCAGKLLIDMSTVSPAVSRALAARVREKGADMPDAPVSGSIASLLEGKLSFMVGGDRATFDRAKPLLEEIGPRVTHVGENGLGLTMKIATNLSLAVQMLAFSEGVLLADMMQKDMLMALEMGRQMDVPLPTTATVNEFLTAARGMGLADQDFTVIFKALARMSGLAT